MCGITGYFDLRHERRVDLHVVERMANALIHRGPDSSGFLVTDDVALGFRRLSIIDLATGDQPIFNEDRSIAVTCNGEIYNYRELRDELLGKGHTFRTQSDVEVLVHLYEELGPEMVRRLNGQFAFVIYDGNRRTLLFARDHFGIAPLYYTVVDGLVVWGSEIRAVLAHPRVPREVDLTGLDQVLSLPGVIAPRTMFQGIHSLPPGHYMTVENDSIKTTQYWDLDYPRAVEATEAKPERYFVEHLAEAFERSVRYRLQADVPVGFYLSGGLDSSLIAAMIRKLSPGTEHHSFSVGFTEARIDEGRYQRLVAKFVDSVHHEVRFDESEIASRLSDVVYHAECPLKETYNTASLALSRMTRDAGVRVVLNGEGSDELFGGYVGYRFDKRRAGAPRKHDLETLLGDELRAKMWGDADLHYEKDEHAFGEVKAMLYADTVRARMRELACHNFPIIDKRRIEGRHIVHKRSYLDFKLRLGGHLIADHGDRMAMANSVEARFPFLDVELVELCTRIPPDLKLAGFTEKYILKQVSRGLIPDEIIEREKFGFVAPGSPYLLQRNVEWVQDLLSYERIKRQGYFDPNTIEALKCRYARVGFAIDPALEDDLLIVVLTFGLLLDRFDLPSLR